MSRVPRDEAVGRDGSERVVYLPDALVTILSEHVAAHVRESEPDRWLFTVRDDPLYDNAITWRWSATTTLNTYSHLWPTVEDRTRAGAADLMNQAVRLSLNK